MFHHRLLKPTLYIFLEVKTEEAAEVVYYDTETEEEAETFDKLLSFERLFSRRVSQRPPSPQLPQRSPSPRPQEPPPPPISTSAQVHWSDLD